MNVLLENRFFGFLSGLVESLLYGAYAGLLFVPFHNLFYRRWGR